MRYCVFIFISVLLANCATQQQSPDSNPERSFNSAPKSLTSEDVRQIKVWDSKTSEGSEIAELPEYNPQDGKVELIDMDQFGVAGLVHKAALKCTELHVTVLENSSPQTLSASCDGNPVFGPVLTSTGKGGSTPNGTFTVFDKMFMAYSSAYNNAPMARFLVFHDCGTPKRRCIGIHATVKKNYAKLGQPASHGCVRLTMENAVELWSWAIESGTVKVTVK